MPRKILVVDDNALNRQLLIGILCKDYDIIEACDGLEALELMHKHYKMLSAVLLDIIMPKADGFEVLRKVSENMLLSQIPIIIVTGSDDEESRVKALSLGANDFIVKPYNPDIIRHCLHNNIALRETASILNAIQKDKLTGLFNREAFFDKVGQAIKESKPGQLIMSCFDIDNFKLINDRFGSDEGDRILKRLGTLLREEAEAIGGIPGRISADNFAVLYPTDKQDVDLLSIKKSRNIVLLEQQAISFSVGRYIITDTTLSASSVYDRAFIAKQSIKGRYDKHLAYFDETMLKKLVLSQQITNEMEEALKNRQFEVWFQPQYNHETCTLSGAEALVRWRHPKKGIVPPCDFIPLFEQTGFIYEMDKYVWRETCRYLRKWTDEGRNPLPVSVNVSRCDIYRADLIDVITGLVREFDLPADMLRLEITESAFTSSTELIVEIVKKLIGLGFTIEIDDFGSGYSSLNTLKDVPAQVVKLDMKFLDNSGDTCRGGNILESIVRMTKWLGMTVLAEGVEDKSQADFLKSIGCTYIQGYLYAKPMPAEEYEALCGGSAKSALKLETFNEAMQNAFWDPNSIDTLIFNNYSGGACVYEYRAGKIELLRVSDKYIRSVFGGDMTVEKIMGVNWPEHTDKASFKALSEAVERSIKEGCEVTGNYLFLDLPGCPHEIYLRSSVRVLASAGDRHIVFCISENITRQYVLEQSERELERKRLATAERMQAILDNVDCGVIASAEYDSHSELIFANEKLFKLLGIDKSQLGKRLDKIPGYVCPDDLQKVLDKLRSSVDSDTPIVFEYRVNKGENGLLWVRQSRTNMRFADIDAPIRLSVITDISAEMRSRLEISDTEEQQKLLINGIFGGIATYEYLPESADSKIKITYFNDGFCRLFGYTREECEAVIEISPLKLMFDEDIPKLYENLTVNADSGNPADIVYRVHTKDGGYRWINQKSVIHGKRGDTFVFNAVLVDVTELQDTLSRLRVSEEEYRLATELSGNFVARYNVADRTLVTSPDSAVKFGRPVILEDVPYGPVESGIITKETSDEYIKFYESILSGSKRGSAIFRNSTPSGSRWLDANYISIFDSAGNPISAVISYNDVTEQFEKEAAYRKWRQSLQIKDINTYSLYRCNISKNISYETAEGNLLNESFISRRADYDGRVAEYVKRVADEDCERFAAFMNSDAMLARYTRGTHSASIDYREKTDAGVRWLRLSVDMFDFTGSNDIEAYLMFEDIDAIKREELRTKALTENDPLTNVLNRASFAAAVVKTLSESDSDTKHALLMLDLDGFKFVNDVFGHSVGDKTLVDVANTLRMTVRQSDLVGRLGGDEFLIFLRDISGRGVAAEKARQICSLVRKAFSLEVQISGSIGIALSPRDGADFEELYKKADSALYGVKGSGKDGFAFFGDSAPTGGAETDRQTSSVLRPDKKRHMLIVDDSRIDCEMLANLFKDEFIIEKARDGNSALICMRHYGSSIAVVLLDLMMPGIDGFTVLEKMRESAELQSIPVIIVSGDSEHETCLKALENGASDFVTKPVDNEILRVRVKAAISKSNTERLRAVSSYRELQNDETIRYRTVLERTATAVVEFDWVNSRFTYDSTISKLIAGTYDSRIFWRILLSDMVADVGTVRDMQNFAHEIAGDRTRNEGVSEVLLKTPSGDKKLFVFRIYKIANEFGLTDKLIFTFNRK